MQKHFDETYDDISGDDNYLISLYNLETKRLTKVFTIKVFTQMGDFHRINYIYGNKYLYMCHDNSMEIFDLDKNVKNINIENDVYEYENNYGKLKRIMKKEKKVECVYSNYYDNLFFGSNSEGEINLYMFNNNNLNVYHNFKIKGIRGVIILKNFNFIIYSYKCYLYKFKPIFLKYNK